ncbi:MAG: Uma2 family endonuclease [Eubacteriales bacterium]|nr:Uma2 family endonuclease [Eubacteriales bacterium]
MTVEELKARKKELGYTNETIAELANIPLSTVQKVFSGVTAAPRLATMRALERALFTDPTLYGTSKRWPDRVSEAGCAYLAKKPGDYTLTDYYALPEEKRVELIDGVFYEMLGPSTLHQMISMEIASVLKSYIHRKKGDCIVLTAPTDVQLDCDEKTIVEPDVLVLCDRRKLILRCVYGAPDFIVEVLSKRTKKKDMTLKLHKYSAAGVREYWLVDPAKEKVIVYDLEQEELPVIYGFDAKVPVRIFGGECEVDFAEIREYCGFLYELPEEE